MSLYLYLCTQDFGLLRGLCEDDMVVVAHLLQTRQYNAGDLLCREGEVADCLYMIQTGSVEILNWLSDQTRVRLAIRREGDSIGEMALIDDEVRSATVRCLEPCRVLVLKRRDIHGLIHTHPQLCFTIMMNLLREVSGRLRASDQVSSNALFIHC